MGCGCGKKKEAKQTETQKEIEVSVEISEDVQEQMELEGDVKSFVLPSIKKPTPVAERFGINCPMIKRM